MPIAIILRADKSLSVYRDAIIKSIDSGAGNYGLLCSGFFQENFKGSLYQASAEPGLIAALVKNKVQLDTIGIHNGSWKPSYIQFCNNMTAGGVTLIPYVMSKYHWHAKVFILKKKHLPVFGIIGSSNITANAFGVANIPALASDSPNPPTNFNFECDVFFWDNKNLDISKMMKGFLAQDSVRRQVILARYNRRDNLGRSIQSRLSEIEDQIISAGGIIPLF